MSSLLPCLHFQNKILQANQAQHQSSRFASVFLLILTTFSNLHYCRGMRDESPHKSHFPSVLPMKPQLASTQDVKCTQRAAMEPDIPASPFQKERSAKPLEKQSTATFILAFSQLFFHICSVPL